MAHPVAVIVVYAVAGAVVPLIVFSYFKSGYSWIDVAAASVASALVAIIPTVGEPLSIVVMAGILYLRMKENFFPDVVVAVAASRLAMFGTFLALKLSH